jgi:Tol biopolymer transport system component
MQTMVRKRQLVAIGSQAKEKWGLGFNCALLCAVAFLAQCSYHHYAAPRERGQKWGIAAEHDDVTLLSAIGGSSEYPVWSPDGTRIAFQHTEARSHPADEAASRDIYVVNSTGSGERRLTRGAGNGFSCKYPSWAPESRRLVFSCDADGDYDLYTVEVTSGLMTRLTNYPGNEEYPSWSPDGAHIAFASRMSEERGADESWSIYTVKVDGTKIERLAGGFVHPPRSSWSPDRLRIALGSKTALSSPFKLCILSLGGSEVACHREVPCEIVAWSSDGSQIACTSGDRMIGVDPTTYDAQALLSTDSSRLSGIAWSPDGVQIVFSAGGSFGVANDLYLLDVEP